MTLPKIKHVRAWFIGGATAEQVPAAAITMTRGLTTGLTIISPPRSANINSMSSPGSRLASTCWGR